MPEGSEKRLERRVVGAAEEALADHGFVSPIDVLCRLGWLHRSNVERWRREGAEFGASFDHSARFGLAMMLELAEKSVSHRLPMKLDY